MNNNHDSTTQVFSLTMLEINRQYRGVKFSKKFTLELYNKSCLYILYPSFKVHQNEMHQQQLRLVISHHIMGNHFPLLNFSSNSIFKSNQFQFD